MGPDAPRRFLVANPLINNFSRKSFGKSCGPQSVPPCVPANNFSRKSFDKKASFGLMQKKRPNASRRFLVSNPLIKNSKITELAGVSGFGKIFDVSGTGACAFREKDLDAALSFGKMKEN